MTPEQQPNGVSAQELTREVWDDKSSAAAHPPIRPNDWRLPVPDRIIELATTFLPLDQLRQVLLPPVRVARVGAVTVARSVRHWELALEGVDGAGASDRPATDDVVDVPDPEATADEVVDVRNSETAADDPPVSGWGELSLADAQARLADVDADALRSLLDYERAHGHRPQYTLLLEQRLASRT